MLPMAAIGILLFATFLREVPGHWFYLFLLLLLPISGCLPYAMTLWFAREDHLRPGGMAAALSTTAFWYALCGVSGVLALEPLAELHLMEQVTAVWLLVAFYHTFVAWAASRASRHEPDSSRYLEKFISSGEGTIRVVRVSAAALVVFLLLPSLLVAKDLKGPLSPLVLTLVGMLTLAATAPYVYIVRRTRDSLVCGRALMLASSLGATWVVLFALVAMEEIFEIPGFMRDAWRGWARCGYWVLFLALQTVMFAGSLAARRREGFLDRSRPPAIWVSLLCTAGLGYFLAILFRFARI